MKINNLNSRVVFLITVVAILLLPVMTHAVSNGAVLFLLIEPGSRPGSMGKAFVAQADDGFAGYWNPGAMAFNRKTQLAAMHSNWFGDVSGIDDIYYEYLGWNKYFQDYGNLGASFTYLSYGDIQETSADGEDLGSFSSYELAITFNYGYQLTENLGLGTNFKFVWSDLAPQNAGGHNTSERGRGITYGFDFAVKHKNILIDKLDFGLNLQNVGPDVTYVDKEQSDPMPMNWRMGLSYRLLDSKLNKLTINTDINKELENDDFVLARIATAWFDDDLNQELESIIYSFGTEYIYYDILSLRAGYIIDKAGDFEGPSFGAGFHYTLNNRYRFRIDFAFEQAGELTDYNKTYSLGVDF